MDYGKVLSDAWKTVWKHKILWVLGILAGCGSQTATNTGRNTSGGPTFDYRMDETDFTNLPPDIKRFFFNLSHFIDRNAEMLWLYVTLFVVVILIITIVTFFLRVYGQVGLVRGALLANSGEMEEDEKLSFGQIHAEVGPYFWRLAGLRLLLFLAGLVIALIGVVVFILGTALTLGIGLICLIPLFCLLFPLGWAVAVVLKQAELAIIVEDLGIFESVQRGFDVVRQNIGPYAIMALILMVGGAIVGFILAIPQLLAMAPVFAAFLSSAFQEDWSNLLTGVWVSLACLVAYWPVLLILRGILISFVESSWLLTFIEATRPGEEPDDLQTIESELEPA